MDKVDVKKLLKKLEALELRLVDELTDVRRKIKAIKEQLNG